MARTNPSQIKPLYLATNIKQLQTLKPTYMSSLSCPRVRVCQKLFAEAKESETNGDQEKAFVYFFKYCEVAQTEPRSGTRYMDCEESVQDALDHLEKLTNVLIERYNEKERQEALSNMKTRFKGIQLKTSNQGKSLKLELLGSERKKEIKEKLQADVESQNQIQKVMLKNSEDLISKLKRQISNLQAEVESQNLIHQESLKVSEDQNLRLERQVQDLQDSIMCKLCMDQKVSQFLSPCNHAVCCKNCIKGIKKCPICRKTIESSHIIYFS
jgi:superfamily II helicase